MLTQRARGLRLFQSPCTADMCGPCNPSDLVGGLGRSCVVEFQVQERGVCAHPMDSEDWLAEHLIHLVTSLAAEDKLPVLVFNFEETTCENLAEKVAVPLRGIGRGWGRFAVSLVQGLQFKSGRGFRL